MITNPKFSLFTKILIGVTIFVHCMFFLLEALLWMLPQVHNILIASLDNPIDLDTHLQAIVLKNLFINQGFYNLFLVLTGIKGLLLIKKRQLSSGYILLLVLCFSATGAGIVLAASTKAYLLAFLQAVPAAFAFIGIYPLYRATVRENNK